MKGLTEGRIVLFVTPDGKYNRPAIITQVWNPTTATMTVFTDQPNDPISWTHGLPVVCETSVNYSESHEPRTWHWAEGVGE